MTHDVHERIAERLRDAYQGSPVPPIREEIGIGDVHAAYEVQSINTQYWTRGGRRVVGRKIGLTSVAVQQQLGVAQPDFGVLFDDMLVPDRGQIDTRRLIQPKVEAEVALVLGRDIDVLNPTVLDVLRAVAFALPALEIVDSRVRNWDITIVDTVADNASSGLFVLGSTPTSLSGVDLRACEMTLRVDERVVSKGAGKACLDHPLNALRWLAATVARLGDPLREGEVILTGALGPMAILPAAALVEATVTGLGSVTVSTSTME